MAWYHSCCQIKYFASTVVYFPEYICYITTKFIEQNPDNYNKFNWEGGGRARIKTSVLQQLIKQGALALPDVKLYYSTAMLMALIQGWNMETKNIWYAEQHRDHIPLSKLMLFEPEFFERY